MINVTAEVTIDLDEKRRVWSTSAAELPELPEDAEKQIEVFTSLCIAASNGALQAYHNAHAHVPQTFQDKTSEPQTFSSKGKG